MSNLRRPFLAMLLLCCSSSFCYAAVSADQTAKPLTSNSPTPVVTCTLSGNVSDPSGAKIPGAAVHVQSDALQRDTTSDGEGRFNLALPPGRYAVTITATGFGSFTSSVTLSARILRVSLEAKLAIATETEEVTVGADNGASTSGADNKSALVFKGSDLHQFSDDDSVFQKQIEALGGGEDGNSPSLYVNGFSGGRFPPKNSIREIRINQNPYSVEYEELGYNRIEIFTKPGSDTLHGFLQVTGNDQALNTTDPFLGGKQPPYYSWGTFGDLSGPIGKKTSIDANVQYSDQQINAAVRASTLEPTTLQPTTLVQAVASPSTSATYAARLDRQVTPMNTLTARYEFNRAKSTNAGVGLLVLPEAGTNSTVTTQTLQVTDTQVLGSTMISEAHFQYLRTRLEQDSNSTAPSLNVEGAFTGGGSASQKTSDNQDRYELQEIFTRQQGQHFLRFGARYRLLRDANLSTANYNGAFTFPSLTAYQITLQDLAKGYTDAQIRADCQTTATGPICGGASQFNLTTGQPSAVVTTGDVGVFAEDEWKVTKNLTLDYGIRLETQTAIPDHFDPAPRVGFAWAVGQRDKRPAIVVLRGGEGIFYDRFQSGNILTAIRQNGVSQPSYFVTNPAYYCTALNATSCPTPASLSAVSPTVYTISPHLRSEYQIVEGVVVERSLWKKGTITFNYLYSHGVHQWDSVNLNAPLPGTYVPADPTTGTAASGVYPLGSTQAAYQFQSGGVSNNSRFFTHLDLHPTRNLNLFAFYVIRSQKSDSSSAGNFPSNSYDIRQDYGRFANPRQRLFAAGFWQLPLGLSVNAFLSASAGAPFNITTGTDLNGDTLYNDRPAFATDLTRSSVVQTRYGNFDTQPLPQAKIIPINYGMGPAFVDLDFGMEKRFMFGPRPAAPAPEPGAPLPKGPIARPDPRYALAFSFDAENILNHVNDGQPVGILSSPQFGQSISLNGGFGNSAAATRTISLHTTFSF
jgi:hypothetical protein